jgi:hypothetical protein
MELLVQLGFIALLLLVGLVFGWFLLELWGLIMMLV